MICFFPLKVPILMVILIATVMLVVIIIIVIMVIAVDNQCKKNQILVSSYRKTNKKKSNRRLLLQLVIIFSKQKKKLLFRISFLQLYSLKFKTNRLCLVQQCSSPLQILSKTVLLSVAILLARQHNSLSPSQPIITLSQPPPNLLKNNRLLFSTNRVNNLKLLIFSLNFLLIVTAVQQI